MRIQIKIDIEYIEFFINKYFYTTIRINDEYNINFDFPELNKNDLENFGRIISYIHYDRYKPKYNCCDFHLIKNYKYYNFIL